MVRQVSLCPVWTGSGSGLREGVEALSPSVTSLALLFDLPAAEREGGEAGGAWRLRLWLNDLRPWLNVPAVLELCAAFDQPGLPCGLVGRMNLLITPPAVEAGPGVLGAYLGQCAELAGRLRSGGTPSGMELGLKVGGSAAGAGGGGGGLLGSVLGAMLPEAAPHMASLRLIVVPGTFSPGFSRHLTPGLAFPLLTSLELTNDEIGLNGRALDAVDVAALARLDAPRLGRMGLLPVRKRDYRRRDGLGASSTTVTALAMGLARPVDAEGRPAGLQLCVVGGREVGLERALQEAGRGWVSVVWPPHDYDDDYYDDDD